MKNFKYCSINRVIADIDRDFGITDINEGDLIEWVGKALEGIGCVQQYQEAVAFIEVKNHQCSLPSSYHGIIQIARNMSFQKIQPQDICDITPTTVEEPVSQVPSVPFPVILDCQGQPITDYEVAYYRPYFDFSYGYNNFRHFAQTTGLSPVRKAAGSFSDVLICDLPGESKPYHSSDSDEYMVVAGEILRFNFKEGQIALAFLRNPVDEQGLPMIPDNYSYLQAVAFFVAWKYYFKQALKGRQGAMQQADILEGQWQWYCGQATQVAMMPHGIDEWENLKEQASYFIPRTQQYNSFFGRLNRGKNDGYTTPYRPVSA